MSGAGGSLVSTYFSPITAALSVAISGEVSPSPGWATPPPYHVRLEPAA
jgi:hypothetical protein